MTNRAATPLASSSHSLRSSFISISVHCLPTTNISSFSHLPFLTSRKVLRFIATHLDIFGDVLEKNIVAARLGVYKPKYATTKTTALEGFRALVNHKVSGIAVIDSNHCVPTSPALHVSVSSSSYWVKVSF